MKKILIGLLIGNLVHFAGRELGSVLKALEIRQCRINSEECKESSLLTKILLFEFNLGSKFLDP